MVIKTTIVLQVIGDNCIEIYILFFNLISNFPKLILNEANAVFLLTII